MSAIELTQSKKEDIKEPLLNGSFEEVEKPEVPEVPEKE